MDQKDEFVLQGDRGWVNNTIHIVYNLEIQETSILRDCLYAPNNT
jgi:hypothetical protein